MVPNHQMIETLLISRLRTKMEWNLGLDQMNPTILFELEKTKDFNTLKRDEPILFS